jgi:hypothetical protein
MRAAGRGRRRAAREAPRPAHPTTAWQAGLLRRVPRVPRPGLDCLPFIDRVHRPRSVACERGCPRVARAGSGARWLPPKQASFGSYLAWECAVVPTSGSVPRWNSGPRGCPTGAAHEAMRMKHTHEGPHASRVSGRNRSKTRAPPKQGPQSKPRVCDRLDNWMAATVSPPAGSTASGSPPTPCTVTLALVAVARADPERPRVYGVGRCAICDREFRRLSGNASVCPDPACQRARRRLAERTRETEQKVKRRLRPHEQALRDPGAPTGARPVARVRVRAGGSALVGAHGVPPVARRRGRAVRPPADADRPGLGPDPARQRASTANGGDRLRPQRQGAGDEARGGRERGRLTTALRPARPRTPVRPASQLHVAAATQKGGR